MRRWRLLGWLRSFWLLWLRLLALDGFTLATRRCLVRGAAAIVTRSSPMPATAALESARPGRRAAATTTAPTAAATTTPTAAVPASSASLFAFFVVFSAAAATSVETAMLIVIGIFHQCGLCDTT